MTYNNIRNKFVVALYACFCEVMASDSVIHLCFFCQFTQEVNTKEQSFR